MASCLLQPFESTVTLSHFAPVQLHCLFLQQMGRNFSVNFWIFNFHIVILNWSGLFPLKVKLPPCLFMEETWTAAEERRDRQWSWTGEHTCFSPFVIILQIELQLRIFIIWIGNLNSSPFLSYRIRKSSKKKKNWFRSFPLLLFFSWFLLGGTEVGCCCFGSGDQIGS